MTAYHVETVETPAGTYVIELHSDEDSPNPLTDWDHEGMAFYIVGSRNGVMLDTLDEAGAAGNAVKTWVNAEHYIADIERRFALWRALTGNPWILVTGNDFDSQESWGWLVLADTSATYIAGDGKKYPMLPQPESAARSTMDTYRTWANGEVCGYVVLDPAGNEIDALWGMYGADYALGEARGVVQHDATERAKNASLAGAGFVGIV